MPAISTKSGNREVDNDEPQNLIANPVNSNKENTTHLFRKPQVVAPKFKTTSIKHLLHENETTTDKQEEAKDTSCTIATSENNSSTTPQPSIEEQQSHIDTHSADSEQSTAINIEEQPPLSETDNKTIDETPTLKKTEVEANTEVEPTTNIPPIDIDTIWKTCVEQLSDEYYAAKKFLHKINITEPENNIIEIHVGGSSIKEILLPTIPILSAALSQQLRQSYTLSVIVEKSQNANAESFIDYSNPETILNNIIKENEAVLELKEKLNLHLIYK